MKQLLFLGVLIGIGPISLAQQDSVWIRWKSKLITDIEIILPLGDQAVKEHYTRFKFHYWLQDTDTVPITEITQTPESSSGKKGAFPYATLARCDSTVNAIRNEARYWDVRTRIAEIARVEIGYRNPLFQTFQRLEENQLRDLDQTCTKDFIPKLNAWEQRMLQEISRIRTGKNQRLEQLTSHPIDTGMITAFLATFDACETDFRSLEVIILKDPEGFVHALEKLEEFDFESFTWTLDRFPTDANTAAMKQRLEESPAQGKRKKRVIRKIKKRKTV